VTDEGTEASVGALVVIAVTQVAAWGSTYYPVSVLSRQIAAGLGAPVQLVMAAPTALLVATALVSVPTARLLGRWGPRPVMSGGTLVGAAGLGLVAVSTAAWSYLAGWVVAGIAGGAMLTLGAQVAIARYRPCTAQRDLRLMMLATCLAPTISWPVTAWLSPLGWRAVFGIDAMVLTLSAGALFVALPRVGGGVSYRADDSAGGPADAGGPLPVRRLVPLIGGISLNGFVSSGLPLVFIPFFVAAGLDKPLAVSLAAAIGGIQAGARALTLLLRLPAYTEVIAATAVMLVGTAALFLLPGGGPDVAVAAVALFGLGSGVIAVARSTLPYALFEPAAYARVSGALSLPLNLVYALSPVVFAALLGDSPTLAIGLAAVLIVAALGSLVVLRAQVIRA
jgi:predicted MFS family arabinose efflux permease